MQLRPYQQEIINSVRANLRKSNSTCVQLATGGGKTAIFAEILSRLHNNNVKAWVVVPRIELLTQASNHLKETDTPHNMISANRQESYAYNIHVVSRDTLTRRIEKTKCQPQFIIIDEAHIALDKQIFIRNYFPESKMIGFTATPERTDGRGLSELYKSLVEGPSIPELTNMGFLSKLRYFAPPIEGVEKIKITKGDFDAKETEIFLTQNRIYGKAIEHYKNHGDGKRALVFCRSVEAAYETAKSFCNAGYKFKCIEGRMADHERKVILDDLKSGKINGVTNCDLATYGLDIPAVEIGICLRPTLSRALYMQMIGRILRPHDGKVDAVFLDHVGNLIRHQDDNYPGVPLHYIPKIEWNFYGKQKRKNTVKPDISIKMCPNCFMYFEGDICPNCGAEREAEKRGTDIEVVDGELKELKFRDVKPDIDKCIESKDLNGLVDISNKMGYSGLWIYHQIKPARGIDKDLLKQIAVKKGYKSGWVYTVAKNLG